ncbi:hypothetical protein PBI_BETHLEHEM_65 [Mycobacterium phage Bethlehem]|uniref:Uncharacterized protein n=1 Tax=Mycobacterium phage Bethlehem TaxID=2902891 RepID=Q5J5F9_9CAUD|nr:gp64 [Mycobacterium phage Bethlehem]AAR89785.1 hypothetical protein PBI_BETHLEHEM_65 [Mycobacterium phage Bethlehem]
MKLLGIVAGGIGIAGALVGGIVGIAREALSQDIVSDIPEEEE